MLKKRFLKGKNVVQVTFYTAAELDAEEVCLVGDFNNWDESATPMQALKDGRFKTVLELEPECEFQFRYLIDGCEWHNEWEADRYVPNPHGSDNCVVCT
jgi:1,4-alpha-glucan branching enzyme